MTDGPLAAFVGQKYLSLETYRKTGQAVRTPLWFATASDGAVLYVYTLDSSGKTKRLRRLPEAKIAPCDMRGGITGSWMPVRASFVSGETYKQAMQLLDRKYWPLKPLMNLLTRLARRRERVVIALRPV